MRPLLRESADLFLKGLSPSDRKIEIELECDAMTPRVRVDAGRLMQVFFNLMSNAQQAVSSSDRGGRILVRACTSEDQGRRWVLVEVVDDGPGVPEEYIDRLFDPFFTTKENGTGYGLYLAAEILKENAGRLSVQNNPAGGATFTIWLPEESDPRSMLWGICRGSGAVRINLDIGAIERLRVGPGRPACIAREDSISKEPDQCPRRSLAGTASHGRVAGRQRF